MNERCGDVSIESCIYQDNPKWTISYIRWLEAVLELEAEAIRRYANWTGAENQIEPRLIATFLTG